MGIVINEVIMGGRDIVAQLVAWLHALKVGETEIYGNHCLL